MTYKVLQGETVPAIAKRYGFHDWKIIYNHPENTGLRELRSNPNLLHPGDQLFIPERRIREELCATDARHTFRAKQAKQKLKIALTVVDPLFGDEVGTGEPQPVERLPLANVAYELEIEGKLHRGSTDNQGRFEADIPVDARVGKLTAGKGTWALSIGDLNPVIEETPDDNISGAQGRLKNLGYYLGPINGTLDEETMLSVRQFQTDEQLELTGAFDDETLAKLRQIHGL